MTVPTWPFVGTEALARGEVSSGILRRKYDRVYRNVYAPKGSELTPAERAVAAWLWSGRQSTVAGLSAAALYGAKWIDPSLPAELYRRNGKPVAGILIHRDELVYDERQLLRGISLSTPARTAFDLGRRRGRTVALVRVDALANTTGLQPPAVESLIERHPGARGLRQLREVVELMDGGPSRLRKREPAWFSSMRDCRGRRHRSSLIVGVSTWVAPSSRSASNTTGNNTGRTHCSTRATSTGTRNCWHWDGSSCG